MKKLLLSLVAIITMVTTAFAGEQDKRLSFGVGLLYENGLDATISYEKENAYHNAWEFFANGYLKWADCESCGHVCPDSFWKNYRTWSVGAAYKPCIVRGRNHYGNLRFGGSLGSDTHKVLGGIHAGYEHNYRLKGGWQLYWQVKTDLMIRGEDLFRTGVAIGVKLPLN
jgi:hypothetical protein